MNTWKRCPSASVKHSVDRGLPGVGRHGQDRGADALVGRQADREPHTALAQAVDQGSDVRAHPPGRCSAVGTPSAQAGKPVWITSDLLNHPPRRWR
jgi:hypothetical protein